MNVSTQPKALTQFPHFLRIAGLSSLIIQNLIFYWPIFFLFFSSSSLDLLDWEALFGFLIISLDLIGFLFLFTYGIMTLREQSIDISRYHVARLSLLWLGALLFFTFTYRLTHLALLLPVGVPATESGNILEAAYSPFVGDFFLNYIVLLVLGLVFWNFIIFFTQFQSSDLLVMLSAIIYAGLNLIALLTYQFYIGFLIKTLIVPFFGILFYINILFNSKRGPEDQHLKKDFKKLFFGSSN